MYIKSNVMKGIRIMTQTLAEWSKKQIGKEYYELPNLSVQQQLDRYDSAETGVGFILVLAAITTDVESEYPEPTHFNVCSIPAVRIRGEWVTLEDENLADILTSLIRIVAPREEA